MTCAKYLVLSPAGVDTGFLKRGGFRSDLIRKVGGGAVRLWPDMKSRGEGGGGEEVLSVSSLIQKVRGAAECRGGGGT